MDLNTPTVDHAARLQSCNTTKRSSVGVWALWWLIALGSLWFRTGFPTHAISTAIYDDELFIRAARYLGAGLWLGPYDNLTLAKGMFYPLFILITFLLGIPLGMAEQAVYLAVSALAACLVRRVTNDRKLALLLFAVLAFNPVLWHWEMDRVIREGLYISLSLAVVILFIGMMFPPPGRLWWLRLGYGAACGLVLGAFWLTREEGPWLVPAIAVIVLLSLFAAVAVRPVWAPSIPAWLRSVGLPLAVAVAVFAACNGLVASINYVKYGVFITTEFKATPFLRAYGALARIKQDYWRRFVVFPKDARERAYSVSPAARELAPVLDGPDGENWRQIGCAQTATRDCPEILSGWFMWAFRDAVAAAGHYKSAPEAMRFYTQLADEIDEACASGRIACGPPRATLMPVFHWRYVGDTFRDTWVVGRVLLTMANSQVGSAPSVGVPSGIAVFADMVGSVYPPHSDEMTLQGWAASPAGKPQLSIRDGSEQQVDTISSEMPGPDVTHAYPGWAATRFDLRTSCALASCDLVISVPGKPDTVRPLQQLSPGLVVKTPELRLFFDFASLRNVGAAGAERRAVQLRIAKLIALCYAKAVPALFLLALAGSALALIRCRARPVPLAAAALLMASLAAVVARIVLLAYLDVTSIPSASILYTSPASPFVIVFTVIGCWCLVRSMVSDRMGRRLFSNQFSYGGESSPRISP
jgi:hypothetical protein